MQETSIYDFTVVDINNHQISMAKYKGHVLLIVNVASKCGFTKQYQSLEALYQKYKADGLIILGFPCNQFLNQEPGTNNEISRFCSLKYNVTFPIFNKIEVNGQRAAPIYQFLKDQATGIFSTKSIKWNFTKFLISADGQIIKRYSPTKDPMALELKIKQLLGK